MRHSKSQCRGRLTLDNASSSRGAQMGRPDFYPVSWAETPRLYLRKLRMCGDYDSPGGAYWGVPQNMWVAFSKSPMVCRPSGYMLRAMVSHQVQLFTRANSRNEAKMKLVQQYKEARFYR